MATLCGAALLVPLLSALTTVAIPFELRLLLVVVWALGLARPHWAIGALTLLVPFSSWLLVVVDAPRVRLAEALVLASLSGLIMAAGRPRLTTLGGQRPSLAMPAAIFTAIILASAAVWLRVPQTGAHTLWPFARDFAVYLTHDYLIEPPGASFSGIVDGARLLEGVALVALVAHHTRDGVVRAPHLLAATAIAGAGAALLSVRDLVIHSRSIGQALHQLLAGRTSVHVADVNAAGSHFAMAAVIALALALNTRWTRRPGRPLLLRAAWAAAAVLLLGGVWLTGSRMALIAAIGAFVVVGVTAGPLRPARWPTWAAAALAIVATLALAAVALGIDPRPSAARSASHMLSMRADFMITGLRMIKSAPAFGVGIGRYFEQSGRFMPESIYWFYFHENAHNNFLQVGGELGLTGLAAFVWLLCGAALRLGRGVRADTGDRLLLGAAVGLGAFVATWMTSHPLLVAEVAYPFWIVLGVALARADGNAQPPMAASVDDVAQAFRQGSAGNARRAFVPAVIAVALAVSVPLRAKREIANLDLSKQSFGFYAWESDGGAMYRWTTRRATFFVPLATRSLHLTMRAIHRGGNVGPTEVTIEVGGRVFDHVRLMQDDWVPISLRLPLRPEDEGFQRIDLITSPTWSPALIRGQPKADVRVLGVQVMNPVGGP